MRGAAATLFGSLVLIAGLELAARLSGAHAAFGDSIFQSDKELRWVLRPGLSMQWRERAAVVNSHGFRSPEVDYEHAPRPLILIIGDSVTYGDGVDAPKTFSERLQSLLSGTTVVNAGVPGYGAIQSLGLLKRSWQALTPDIVIYGLCLNDIHDDYLIRRAPNDTWWQARDLRVMPSGLERFLARSALWSWIQGQIRRQRGGSKVPTLSKVLSGSQSNRRVRFAWETMGQTLSDMNDHVITSGGRFMVVCFPMVAQVASPEAIEALFPEDERARAASQPVPTPDGSPAPQRLLAQMCDTQAIPFLDLHPAFAAAGFTLQFLDKIHPSESGHETAAQAIAAFLSLNGMIDGVPPPRSLEATSSLRREDTR